MPGMKTVKCSQQRIDRKWNTNKKSPLLISALQWREFTIDHSLLIFRLDDDDNDDFNSLNTRWRRVSIHLPHEKESKLFFMSHAVLPFFSHSLLTSIHLILLMQRTNAHLWFNFLRLSRSSMIRRLPSENPAFHMTPSTVSAEEALSTVIKQRRR
jgi:hypothetical protein